MVAIYSKYYLENSFIFFNFLSNEFLSIIFQSLLSFGDTIINTLSINTSTGDDDNFDHGILSYNIPIWLKFMFSGNSSKSIMVGLIPTFSIYILPDHTPICRFY